MELGQRFHSNVHRHRYICSCWCQYPSALHKQAFTLGITSWYSINLCWRTRSQVAHPNISRTGSQAC